MDVLHKARRHRIGIAYRTDGGVLYIRVERRLRGAGELWKNDGKVSRGIE